MLRRTKNPNPGKIARLARQCGVSLEQLRMLVRTIGWDCAVLDAAIDRLRGQRASANDNVES